MKRGPGTGQGGLGAGAMVQEEVGGGSASDSAVIANLDQQNQEAAAGGSIRSTNTPTTQGSGSTNNTMTQISGISSIQYWGRGVMSLIGVTPTSK